MKVVVWGCAVLGLLTGVGALCAPLLTSHSHCGGEQSAGASLKTIVSAQADFRENDRDGDGVKQFWRADVAGLYGLLPKDSAEMIKLIELSVAAADLEPVGMSTTGDRGPGVVKPGDYAVAAPKAGYWFVALRLEDEVEGPLDPQRFAFCAVPDSPASGKLVYAVTHAGVVWEAAARIGRDVPRAFPLDPEKAGWRIRP